MKLFAIEMSSRFGSIALIEDGKVTAEERWEEDFKNRQQLFDALSAMKVDWESIDVFAAGRGPGAFSGMRIGLSVVNALAAPDGRPVYVLNSGAVIAAQAGAERTVVVGDARRSKVWAGCFDGTEIEGEFQLLTYDELAGFIPGDALVVSPDHDRLEELLSVYKIPEGGRAMFPSAGVLGRLACQKIQKGEASEPLEPLYMHPPVFVEPRFPA